MKVFVGRFIALGAILLSLTGGASASANELGTAYAQQVQQMYVAYYGRPGDPGGIDYWADRLADAGGNWIADLIDAFGTSPEYTERFGGLPPETLIDNLFGQLFNRDADAIGRGFYIDLLNGSNTSGLNPALRQSTLAQIAVDIANGAQGEDLVSLKNKLGVADYFTRLVDLTGRRYASVDIDEASAIIGAVTASPDTITIGKIDTDVFFGLDTAPAVILTENIMVDEGAGFADFLVRLSAPSLDAVSVYYTTGNGTASYPNDYDRITDTPLSFAPGEMAKTVRVLIADDPVVEGDESFYLNLTRAENAVIGTAKVSATIVDNDGIAGMPVIEVSDVLVDETADAAVFALRLDLPSDADVSVAYATVADSADEGDFSPTSGDVTFAPGEMLKTVGIPVIDDGIPEGTEQFALLLSAPVNAHLIEGRGVATIASSDQLPVRDPFINVDHIMVDEGAGFADFLVRLSAPSLDAVSVYYTTGNGTASYPNDYDRITDTPLSFAPGETARTVRVLIADDPVVEGDESFYLNLTRAENTVIGTATVSATLVDNDGIVGMPVIQVSDVLVDETAGAAVFTLRLDLRSDTDVSVAYATVADSADEGDFSPISGDLTFTPGEMLKTVRVPVIDDRIPEGTEQFALLLSAPVNAHLIEDRGVATIASSDQLPVSEPFINVDNVTVDEDAGFAELTVRLSAPSRDTVSVYYTTGNGTASYPNDYDRITDTPLSFAPGEMAKTVRVLIADDPDVEGDESFFVNLSRSANAIIGNPKVTVTLIDND